MSVPKRREGRGQQEPAARGGGGGAQRKGEKEWQTGKKKRDEDCVRSHKPPARRQSDAERGRDYWKKRKLEGTPGKAQRKETPARGGQYYSPGVPQRRGLSTKKGQKKKLGGLQNIKRNDTAPGRGGPTRCRKVETRKGWKNQTWVKKDKEKEVNMGGKQGDIEVQGFKGRRQIVQPDRELL